VTELGGRIKPGEINARFVSSDFMNTALRKAISPAFDAPGGNGKEC